MPKVKIGVLISGGGTNLQAIIKEIEKGNINGEIALVISDKEDAYGLERAKKYNIKALVKDKKGFEDKSEFMRAIIDELENHQIELVVLAGFMSILNEEFVGRYKNQIINVHPSLIPAFCGEGFYGERVHRAVLEYGVKVSGATVHFVDEGADTGPVILQEAVSVMDDDSIESLAGRILKVEHKLLPKAIKLFCENKLTIKGRKVMTGALFEDN